MARYAKFTVVPGRRQTGKTNETLEQLYNAVRNGRKAIVYDCMDEFGAYIYRPDEPPHKISPIYLKDIPRFSVQNFPEIRRIRPYNDDGTRMTRNDLQENLAFVLNNFKNGILLIEDINKYVADNAPSDIIGSLATLRQASVDVIAHFQLVGKVANPKIMGMANYIRLHKTNDSVKKYAEGFQDMLDIMMIAENIVEARYMYGVKENVKTRMGTYFSVVVDLESYKIRGIFTEHEAEAAIEKYLAASKEVTTVFNEKDRFGNKVWNSYSEAYTHIEQKLLNDYFDFTKKEAPPAT